eukprot:NODE_162_length_16547_cov_0.334326.p1 type:complete len:431 gc:universal NODE_162_length_16547_cov_0.334326:16316-15024(-)
MKQEFDPLPAYSVCVADLLFNYISHSDYLSWTLVNKEFKSKMYMKRFSQLTFTNLEDFSGWLSSGVHSYLYYLGLENVLESQTIENIPNNWIKLLLEQCPNLTVLNLSKCWFLNDQCIYMLDGDHKLKHSIIYHALSSIDLSFTSITEKAFVDFLSILPNLKRIVLIDVSCIGPRFKSYIWEKKLQSIYELILDSNEDVDDELLTIISKNCLSLSKLSISNCKVTNYGVSLVLSLPYLWHINVSYCAKISNAVLHPLKHPKLLGFQAVGTSMVFDHDCLAKLAIHCLECLIIGYNQCYINKSFMGQFSIPSTSSISTFAEALPIGNPQILPKDLKYFYFVRRIIFIVEDVDLYLPHELLQLYINMASATCLNELIVIYKGHCMLPIQVNLLNCLINGPMFLNGDIKTCNKRIKITIHRDWIESSNVQFKL